MPARIPSFRPKGPKRPYRTTYATMTPEARERHRFLTSSKWRKLRAAHLRQFPLCADCEDAGILTVAREVHHMAKRADAPGLEMDGDNLRSLCSPCHGVRTARGE